MTSSPSSNGSLASGGHRSICMDNGPELVAHALRDWCRLRGTAMADIDRARRGENPCVVSFIGRCRDEPLNIEEVASLLEAQLVVEVWASTGVL
jgi:putative transposase